MLHRLWQCECNLASEDPIIIASEVLNDYDENFDAFWLRGLVPKPWVQVAEAPTEQFFAVGTCPPGGKVRGLTAFTDGS